MDNFKRENIVIAWLAWHFYQMPKFLIVVWNNYFSFGADFFSVPLLLSTLFSPWRRYKWRYPKGFNLGEYFSAFISNLFSRIVGAMVRMMLVVVGFLLLVFIGIAGAVLIIAWIAIPFFLVGLIFFLFTDHYYLA